jgi:sugar phosphate isomerase/epimerase
MKTTRCLLSSGVLLWTLLGGGLAGAQTAEDYSLVRIKKFPFAMQCYTYRRYTFMEAIEKTRALGIKYLQAYPGQALSPQEKNVKLDHNLSPNQIERVKKAVADAGLEVVSYGVVDMGRTEASMRQVFDFARRLGIRTIVTEPQDGDYPILEPLVKEYGIRIAVHNHPEPNKYAKPETVLERVKNRDERIGSCADTGHWMRGGLRPVDCLKLLSGRIIDVHIKDRSDFGTAKGVDDVAFGQGKANIHDILAELTLQDYGGCLTIEFENESEVLTPEPTLRKGIDYVKGITYYENYDRILRRANWQYSKHGWNHYGPGYFELDEKTGVLRSQGGMGLLWYSAKKYKDFVLELDYKCAQDNTNSGVFVRVPDVPSSDDYIYHSFEVQISDVGDSLHKTGAIYDAEPATRDAWKPAGQWNHMKITCRGKHIDVEINGVPTVSWDMEPRGKVKDFSLEGYVGLQNHDSIAPVFFRDVYIKEI